MGGLNLFNPAKQNFTRLKAKENDPSRPMSNGIRTMYRDPQDMIWLGYNDGNFSQFDPEAGVFKHFETQQLMPAGSKRAQITSIASYNNQIWLTTDGNGIFLLDKTTQKLSRWFTGSAAPLFSDRLTQVFIDNQQQLWLASYDSGVMVGRPQLNNFRHLQHRAEQSNSLAANLVHHIYQDHQQRIWIGTEAGISIWDGRNQFKNYSSADSLTHDKVLSIFEDSTGFMWIGTFHGLVNAIEVPFEHYDKGLASNVIMGFAETRSSNQQTSIWVASYGGLTRLDENGKIQQVFDKNSQTKLKDVRVMSIKGDNNLLWFGMRAGGLGRLNVDNGSIDYFSHNPDEPNSLSFDGVTTIYPDSMGNVWVGTYGGA
ncbi:two-component regulator propeller domain-containing protein [Paraglaciecola aquimarina]|uniref:Two-component regulator propeller domain-containing protein n=1 Tax=Paraglaciecola aquimarina TaxID=1235557 RepID=A0ABU3SSX2_9ALTE|nr:two-component regulator propeller domain-containing protein [Paraglaciecola aquimarina]MDU0353085.1 two-component regulator propeller domain-containing protein [Paraglaciecola aquimarina]